MRTHQHHFFGVKAVVGGMVAAVVLAATCGRAFADEATDSLTNTTIVANYCTVATSTLPIAYDPVANASDNQRVMASVTTTCTNPAAQTVTVGHDASSGNASVKVGDGDTIVVTVAF